MMLRTAFVLMRIMLTFVLLIIVALHAHWSVVICLFLIFAMEEIRNI